MPCSVVKHIGSGRTRKKCRGKHETQSSVFPHFLVLCRFLSALQQSGAQSQRLYLFYDEEPINFLKYLLNFQTKLYFPKE